MYNPKSFAFTGERFTIKQPARGGEGYNFNPRPVFYRRVKRSFPISFQRRRSQRRCTGATGGTSARQFWRATFSCPSWRPSAGGYPVSRAFTPRELPPPRRRPTARVSRATWRRARRGNEVPKSLSCCLVSARAALTSDPRKNSGVGVDCARWYRELDDTSMFTLRVSLLRILDRRYSRGSTAAVTRVLGVPGAFCSPRTEDRRRVRRYRHGAHLWSRSRDPPRLIFHLGPFSRECRVNVLAGTRLYFRFRNWVSGLP